jgi:spermidine synthase
VTASLFIEHQANGIAFYINGELQFHSADETIYHEYLAIPAIALAVERFPQVPLRVLICGGGDGLAARDVLRFPEVSCIDLVDCDAEVLNLGRTTFAPFNQDSLTSPRVQVQVGEAFSWLTELAAQGDRQPYHVIIGDFTYPKTNQETQIYSLEWFRLVRQLLAPGGLVAQNAVSPQRTAKGFWCLYQTILASRLRPKPMQIDIPSFQQHGYGDWGFLLASESEISKAELNGMILPSDLQVLRREQLLKAFVFSQTNAAIRHEVLAHSQASPQLFYYLLNSHTNPADRVSDRSDPAIDKSESEAKVDFLAIDPAAEQQSVQTAELSVDPLQLESLAKVWLEQLDRPATNPQSLLPAQHPYHMPHMTAEWLGNAKQVLSQIDLSRLFKKMLERSDELPPQVVDDLQRSLLEMQYEIPTNVGNRNEVKSNRTTSETTPATTAKVLIMLALTLLVANTIAPDAVFAKGFYSGSSGSYSDSGDGGFGWLGLFMLIGGGVWLANLMDDNSNNR